MDLSVVVPTLNGRERLAASLDALADLQETTDLDVEVIVVNGPSTDGTTGMVRDREDVDVLVEVSDRNVNVSRNAGLSRATGDVVAFLGTGRSVEPGWLEAVVETLAEADVATGPTHRELTGGVTTESPETRTIAGREVAYFNGENVALSASVLLAADGFDEYLETGGARDLAHRLADAGATVRWVPEMSVRGELEADGGAPERDWTWRYRSLAYRLAKNYGPRLTVGWRICRHWVDDAVSALREVASGETEPSRWFATGRDVVRGTVRGFAAGLLARRRDADRNPDGLSARTDRAVEVYDRR